MMDLVDDQAVDRIYQRWVGENWDVAHSGLGYVGLAWCVPVTEG